MSAALPSFQPKSVVVYTNTLWETPMVTLRLTGPANEAGLQVIQGNHFDHMSPHLRSAADIVVIQRDFPRYREEYAEVFSRARQERKWLLYEIDDLLIDMPADHSHLGDYDWVLLSMVRAIAEADGVITSTQCLADYLSALNPNVHVFPNYLNDRIWELRQPKPKRQSGDSLVIGYMGGETHCLDLESILPALRKVMQRYAGKVRLRFWGGKPPEELLTFPQVEWTAIEELDYTRFARFFMQQECDIFIAPLRDNLFNRCKSALKFLEYSALGIPGVYSHLPSYAEVVQHGVNGFLAATLEDWEMHLCALLDSPELRQSVGLQAQHTVQSGWLLSQHRTGWLEAYQATLQGPSDSRQANLLAVLRNLENRERQLEALIRHLEAEAGRSGGQLADILQSRSWRMLQRLQRLRLKLVPVGSRRERLLK